MPGFALHQDPVWRDRANFIINAAIEDASEVHAEQLWTRRDEATDLYEVCCIPFFVYDLALGDLVSTRVDEQGAYVFDQVITPGGHLTFRIYFGQADSDAQAVILKDLSLAPVLIERYSPSLIAVDISEEDSPQRLADYLSDAETRGWLIYETGRTTSGH